MSKLCYSEPTHSLLVTFSYGYIIAESALAEPHIEKIKDDEFALRMTTSQGGGLTMSSEVERELVLDNSGVNEGSKVCYIDHNRQFTTEPEVCLKFSDIPNCEDEI